LLNNGLLGKVMSLELLPEYIEKVDELFTHELPLNALTVEIERELLPENAAILLEAFPIKPRLLLWKEFSSEYQQNIFLEMKNESRQMLLNAMDDEECLPLFNKLDANSLLELTEDMSGRFIEYAISQMTAKQRDHFKKAQDYSEEEVGHWQSFDENKILAKLKVSAAKKICSKKQVSCSEVIYIIDNQSVLLGEVAINKLLLLNDEQPLAELIDEEFISLDSTKNMDEAAEMAV